METYSFLRELADSWVLLAMTLFYVTACLWALSPMRRSANAEAASIPFRNETLPEADPAKTNSGTRDQGPCASDRAEDL